jgi:hypothetical protein
MAGIIKEDYVKFYSDPSEFPTSGSHLCVADGVVYAVTNGSYASLSPHIRFKNSTVPTLLPVGNSIAGQDCRVVTSYTTAIVPGEVRPGAPTIQLVSGGVAALSLVENDTIAVAGCNQQPLFFRVTGISGEVLTLDNRVPLLLRSSAGVSKVTLPTKFPNNHRSAQGVITQANNLSGGPVTILPGYGHGGSLLDQILPVLPELLNFYNPTYIYFAALENDIGAATSTDLAEKLIREIRYASTLCLQYGSVPIWNACLPSNSIDNAVKSAVYDRVNSYISQINSNIRGAKSLNFGRFYLNTLNPNTRQPLVGYTDGVHPHSFRRVEMAKTILSDFQEIVGTGTYGIDRPLLGSNVMLTGTGGTASGLVSGSIVPTGFFVTAQAGVTCLATRSGDSSYRIEATIPGASNVSTTQLLITHAIPMPASYTSGTYVRAVAKLRVKKLKGVSILQLSALVGSGAISSAGNSATDLYADYTLEDSVLLLESVAIPVRDPTATTLNINLSMRPMTLGSPSGVEALFDIVEYGYEVVSENEVNWTYG